MGCCVLTYVLWKSLIDTAKLFTLLLFTLFYCSYFTLIIFHTINAAAILDLHYMCKSALRLFNDYQVYMYNTIHALYLSRVLGLKYLSENRLTKVFMNSMSNMPITMTFWFFSIILELELSINQNKKNQKILVFFNGTLKICCSCWIICVQMITCIQIFKDWPKLIVS